MNPSPPAEPAGERDAAAPPTAIDAGLLRAWPLPYDDDGDKHARGTVLVIGGSPHTVGAVLLSGLAALRIGAGRLQLAVSQPSALAVGVAVPEALVEELPVHGDGRLRPGKAAARLERFAASADAVLIGPGLISDAATERFLTKVVPCIGEHTVVVLDAAAATNVGSLESVIAPVAGRVVITANRREVARIAGLPDDHTADVDDLREMSARHAAIVVSFGDVVAPDGRWWRCDAGFAGLGTSGSGDVLAGLAAGAAARCGRPDQAAVWAAYTHAASGRRLAADVHRIGFIAREIADGVPHVLADVETVEPDAGPRHAIAQADCIASIG